MHTHKINLTSTFTTSALVIRFSTIDHVGNLDPTSIIEIKKSSMDQVYGNDVNSLKLLSASTYLITNLHTLKMLGDYMLGFACLEPHGVYFISLHLTHSQSI